MSSPAQANAASSAGRFDTPIRRYPTLGTCGRRCGHTADDGTVVRRRGLGDRQRSATADEVAAWGAPGKEYVVESGLPVLLWQVEEAVGPRTG